MRRGAGLLVYVTALVAFVWAVDLFDGFRTHTSERFEQYAQDKGL